MVAWFLLDLPNLSHLLHIISDITESVVNQYISDDLGLPNEEPKVDHLNGTTEKCAAGAA
jgi:hypothetical protein